MSPSELPIFLISTFMRYAVNFGWTEQPAFYGCITRERAAFNRCNTPQTIVRTSLSTQPFKLHDHFLDHAQALLLVRRVAGVEAVRLDKLAVLVGVAVPQHG